MIGIDAEKAGTIRAGTRAVLTAHTFELPWASIIVRKAYGVAQALEQPITSHYTSPVCAQAAHFAPGAYVLSWPSAEAGTLPVESGVAVAFARAIREAPDPDQKRLELEKQFAKMLSPFPGAEALSVHNLIRPDETRLQVQML